MTRINLCRPIQLADQHLIAEIKEINQLSGSFRISLNSKKGIIEKDLPLTFTLNTGHVKFFYNKGLYLFNRFNELKQEALKRGFNIQSEFNNEWLRNNQTNLYRDWLPEQQDKDLIIERITERVLNTPKAQKKDNWYRYYNKPISNLEYTQNILTL
jgi:deoxyribonuclease (pyrimidine dimer)